MTFRATCGSRSHAIAFLLRPVLDDADRGNYYPGRVLNDGTSSGRLSAKCCAARLVPTLGLYAGGAGLQIVADFPVVMPDRFDGRPDRCPGEAPAAGQVAACIFLLIPRRGWRPEQERRPPGAASNARPSPAGGLRPRRPSASIVNPCRSLLITRPRGSARNGRRIVKTCKSLVSERPNAEAVRSGGSRTRHHGHRPPPRPPSPLLESGGQA
jgi:hypothetical protein